MNISRNAINAKNLHQMYTNKEESSNPYPALGHLPSGAWILSALSPKRQGIKDIYWSAQTISPNGLKLDLWRISKTLTPKSLFGKISSPDSGSLIPSFRTMDFNSTANLLGDIVMSWELQTNIPLQLIPKETDKLKLLTRS